MVAVVSLAVLVTGAAALQAAPKIATLEKPAVVSAPSDADLLVRAAGGEATERTPVWLMRQAGRYMKDFRAYSDKYPFRHRSETPEIATELSLQCWKKFGVDGVIMFSDILTPLPAMGVEFDVVKGRGPLIEDTLRSAERIKEFCAATKDFDPESQLAFVGQTLQNLKAETEGKTTLVGFVGAPWTLAAYSTEGGASKHALQIKRLMRDEPELAHAMLQSMADTIATYACFQIDQGAQMIQVFESWAHQLSPLYFEVFAKPYANLVAQRVKEKHPNVPVLFFANGGSSYLELQKDMVTETGYNGLSLDWAVDITEARKILGDVTVQGNVDPTVLLGSEKLIKDTVKANIEAAGGGGKKHILNLGHGVLQQTPEDSVAAFVDAAKEFGKAS